MNNFRLAPGTVLADKYRLESVLGTGGMGTVYQAQHLALNAPVAVKVIDREVDEGDVALARFMLEAQSAASLRSPHVVQILDYGMEGKRPFMVMEMLEGEPLASRIKRLGRLTPHETFRVISHISRAVSKAHEADIIHRDLKPDNVFLVHNEGDEIAKVLDFGVAKVEATQLDKEGHTRTGSLLGTPYYMSPEQAQGNKDIDARSDLWALGVIAFECMTGKRPFSSDGLGDLVLQICIRDIPIPSKVVPVPLGFDEWFKKACSRDPDTRFQTARDLAESLREALDLGIEAGAAIPESKWVSSRASLHARTLASEAPTLGGEMIRPDPSRRLNYEDARPTRIDPPHRENDEERKPSSQWEVVPHGENESAPRHDFVPFGDTIDDIEQIAGLPQRRSETSGGGSLAFVAIIALMIGGAVVFGIRHMGIDSSGNEAPVVRTRPIDPAAPKPTVAGVPGVEKQNPEVEAESAPGGVRPPGEEGKPPADVEPGQDPVDPADKAAVEADPSAEEPAEESLAAIEEAAREALKDREKTQAEKDAGEQQNKSDQDGASDKGTSGPQPKLPDGLAPPPAPPPPAP